MVKNVTVGEGAAPFTGETVDLGVMALSGWWTYYSGYVFSDTNRNGVRDPGELGVPNFTLTLRSRNNTLADRGTNTATTDQNGFYEFESGYPFTTWVVLEAYSDSYFTTGVTYQADNQPDPTTILDPGVDLNTLSVIGQSGTVDWGVHAYDATGATGGLDPRNGGIVGTVSYDTTRNELDPRYAAVEDWQPGVSGQTVELYAPVDCPADGSVPCDADGTYALDPATGGYEFGPLLNTYVTETWEQPVRMRREGRRRQPARVRDRPGSASVRPELTRDRVPGPDRPMHRQLHVRRPVRRQLRRERRRQLRLRRRLLRRNRGRRRPRQPPVRGRGVHVADRR